MLLNAVWLVVEPPISKTFGTLNPKSHEDYIRTLKTYSVKTKQLSQLFVCSLLPLLDLRHEFPSSALKCKLEIHCRGMPHSCAVEKMIHYGRIWSQNRAPPNFMAQKHHHYFMAIPGHPWVLFSKTPIFHSCLRYDQGTSLQPEAMVMDVHLQRILLGDFYRGIQSTKENQQLIIGLSAGAETKKMYASVYIYII